MSQAMVLAAGLGTRLWPLTLDRAKPAVPFLGTPLVRTLVEQISKLESIRRIVVNTHYQPESIRQALKGLDIRFSHEPEILGTAGCLSHAIASGLLDPKEPVLIVNGKLSTSLSFEDTLFAHARSGAAVTMVLRPNRNRAHFREVLIEGDRVVGFGENRIPIGEQPHLFTGIHVLSPKVLQSIPTGFFDTVRDVYPPLIAENQVHAHIDATGVWREFSTLQRYLDLHLEVARPDSKDMTTCSRGAYIHPEAHVSHSILWENARVEAGAFVERSVIGAGVIIREGETVSDAAVVKRSLCDGEDRGFEWGTRLKVPIPKGPTS